MKFRSRTESRLGTIRTAESHVWQGLSGMITMVLLIAVTTFSVAQTPVITLHDLMIGPVGTTADFRVSSALHVEIETGEGGFPPMDDITVHLQAIVRYTVLPHDKLTKQPRLSVQAYALNPETGLPLSADHHWELIYGIRADQVVYVGGDALDSVHEEYLELIEPRWLIDWPLTRRDDRSPDPLVVGREWTSTAGLPNSDDVLLPITGVLLDWSDMGELGPMAHIMEKGEGTDLIPPGMLDGYGTVADSYVTMEQHYWAVPGQFPLYAELYSYMGSAMVLEGLADWLAAFSTTNVGIEFILTYERDLDRSFDILAMSGPAAQPIEPGKSVTGRLGPGSDVLDDGSYVAYYTFEGRSGDRITARLESVDFDAYLYLMDDDGYVIDYDDDSGGIFDALIRTALPWDGTFQLWATSWDGGEEGEYSLSLEFLPPFNLDDALASLARLREPDTLSLHELQQMSWLLDDLMDMVLALHDDLMDTLLDSLFYDNFIWDDVDWDNFDWGDYSADDLSR